MDELQPPALTLTGRRRGALRQGNDGEIISRLISSLPAVLMATMALQRIKGAMRKFQNQRRQDEEEGVIR
jgi:hypothetical protein